MRNVPGGAEIQVGVTTFVGRSHTEIARLIAFDHGWKLVGDQVIDADGVVVAQTLEELGRKTLAMGWFHPSGAHINWHHFGGTKELNAQTIRDLHT
ncbi:hypothetical protein [[Mycobacterium] zoologicum]|uniref:hypothetical protein n=1 Tax=[Mycobacterium] zoologicum TaxID=2872311 RepID=UPI001CDADD99|nr:hypothetical protein [Mycolicibacter sp. MYC101]MEB3063271.1 hypothetical protein [Mycolicibacter sp. MYC101]